MDSHYNAEGDASVVSIQLVGFNIKIFGQEKIDLIAQCDGSIHGIMGPDFGLCDH